MSGGGGFDNHWDAAQALTLNCITKVVSFTGTSSNVQLTSGTTLIQIFASEDCWIKLGSSSVSAAAVSAGSSGDSTFIPGGIVDFYVVDLVKTGAYLAVIRNSSSGTLYIKEGA